MTKKIFYFMFLVFLVLLLGCSHSDEQGADIYDATDYGLSVKNDGKANSAALQSLIDRLSSDGGGTVYIPRGEYEFCENGTQTIGSHCIRIRSNVSIIGDGGDTVLRPVGASAYGLDMFYFNDYLDTGMPIYLENCRFEDFVIDAMDTSCEVYTSSGKGFMFNLFKGCHWSGVTVKNTDATGFGVDCPIDSSITDCVAIGCGKAATLANGGASGFGIGYGYSEDEDIIITDCTASGNKKFGFFFEHQGRFNSEMYSAEADFDFSVTGSISCGNAFGFGGICASGITYDRCTSEGSMLYGFYFEDCSMSRVISSVSKCDSVAGFSVEQTDSARYTSSDISFSDSSLKDSPLALLINGGDMEEPVGSVYFEDCALLGIGRAVHTRGHIHALVLKDNLGLTKEENILSSIDELTDENNAWN